MSASDIDGWISQAKQLRAGIESCQSQSDEIVSLGQDGRKLAEAEEDAATKVTFVKDELAFYDRLATTAEQIQSLSTSLDHAHGAVEENKLLDAIGFLKKVDADLQDFQGNQSTAVGGLLADRAAQQRDLIVASLTQHWSNMIQIDRSVSKVTLNFLSEGMI